MEVSADKRSVNLFALVGSFLAVAFLVAVFLQPIVRADGSGWLQGAPQIEKTSDATQADWQTNSSCTRMILPVVHIIWQKWLTNNEEHCMVQTSAGLVDDMVTVIQPIGYDKAFVINNNMAGRYAFAPTPNYPGALLISSDSVYPGVNIGLYKLLTNHLKFNNNLLAPAYNLTAPDVHFKYPSGRSMAFNGTSSFSSSGTYWVNQAVFHGFVRVNLTTLQMTTFAANTPVDSGGNPQGAITAISPSGKYAAVAYNSTGGWGSKYFKIVDVDSCGNATGAYVKETSTCKTADYYPDLKKAIPGLVSIGAVKFANDNSLNFVVQTVNGSTTRYARYAVTAAGQPQRLEQYLALGDSFASGEGTFNYVTGTETDVNKCHLSILSYPFLMTDRVGSTKSVACSGAVADNLIGNDNHNENNQLIGYSDTDITDTQISSVKSSHTPGVILQKLFVDQDNPQVITVSIGGNEETIKFSDIVKKCVSLDDCYASYEDRLELVDGINRQFGNLVTTYKDLKNGDPTRRVYVIGYPKLVKPDGNCGDNVHFSQKETEFADELVDYLDSVIERAAASAGVGYVDTRAAFDGHRLCEPGEKAVNGLTAGNDTGVGIHDFTLVRVVGQESYHPNKLGHELLAQAILAQTHNLSNPMPDSQSVNTPKPSDPEASILLNAPKENRLVYQVLNVNEDNFDNLIAGSSSVTSDRFKDSTMPNSTFQAVLHSDPVNVGTVQSDGNGVLSGNIQIPAGVAPGFHTLHLYGKDIFGGPLDVQIGVYVEASIGDYDGDGIANSADSCVTIPNSGHDVDQDGIDDACDPVIGDPPVQIPVPPAPIGETLEPTGTVADSNKGNGVIPGDSTTVPGVIGAALQPTANTAAPSQKDAVATILAPNEAVLGQESQVNKAPETAGPSQPGRLTGAYVGIIFVALFGLGLALFAYRRFVRS